MVLLFGVWWVYFDGIGAVEHQHVRTRRDAVRFHIWSYAHLPLALGVVVLGAGIERTVTAAARTSLPHTDVLIMTLAGLVIATALAVIRATSGRAATAPHSDAHRRVSSPRVRALSSPHAPLIL
jgi:low temperature requirement protein LtrA